MNEENCFEAIYFGYFKINKKLEVNEVKICGKRYTGSHDIHTACPNYTQEHNQLPFNFVNLISLPVQLK